MILISIWTKAYPDWKKSPGNPGLFFWPNKNGYLEGSRFAYSNFIQLLKISKK